MKSSNKLSKVLKLELRHLLLVYPVSEMRNCLRDIYVYFLAKQEAGNQVMAASTHIQNMQALFNFLEIAEDETMRWEKQ